MEKRHTSDEIRNAIRELASCPTSGSYWRCAKHLDVASILRQAADAEDERDRLGSKIDSLDKKLNKLRLESLDTLKKFAECANSLQQAHIERESLRLRLKKVIEECENQIPACRGEDCKCNPTDSGYCDENCHDEIIVHTAVTAILRAARGNEPSERAK